MRTDATRRITRPGLHRILAATLALGLTGCGPSDAAPPDRGAVTRIDTATAPAAEHAGAHDPAAHRALAAAEPTGYSVYHATSVWTDQTGAERTLVSLAGRPVVLAMLYTSCAVACPRLMMDMKRIEGELGRRADDVRFVVVSIDPERDTPERLAEFAAGSRLDPAHWTLLHGDEGDILELAAMLGVQYRRTAPGEWVHSNLITVLDAEGVVAHRQLGLGTDPAGTLEVVRSALD
jgi:protein SCO1/2